MANLEDLLSAQASGTSATLTAKPADSLEALLSQQAATTVPAATAPAVSKADAIRSLLSGDAPVAAMTSQLDSLRMGGIRGAGSIGATLMYPIDKATDIIQGDRGPALPTWLTGVSQTGLGGLVTGQQPVSRNDERRQAMDAGLASLGADTNSRAYQGGKLGMEVAGTLGVGGGLARTATAIPMLARNAAPLIDAVSSGGFSAGGLTGLPGLATRVAGGSITGGASAGLIDPKDAASGALIGAAAPIAIMAAGQAGTYVGNQIAASRAAQAAQQAKNAPLNDTLKAGIDAGYVVPPSSVNPSLWNTTKESFGGKIATAQVAAVKNQNVTDNLVRSSLGMASDAPLSVEALGKYRADQFASGYSPLRQLGTVPADQQFASDLANIANQYTGKGTIPAIQKSEISDLVKAHQSTGFDAGDAVDAIKVLREDATDAFKTGNSALGKAQRSMADAYEGALDRALPQGSPLLANYQNARANIAKSFTVEDALKEGTGSVDARKLASALQGGAPLSGDLLTAARFSSAFPKATQLTSSVAGPGVHNLKAGASGIGGFIGAHFGGPIGAAVGAAVPWVVSPAMRAQMFSQGAQQALLPKAVGGPGLLQNAAGLLANPDAQQSLIRVAPTLRPMGLLNVDR